MLSKGFSDDFMRKDVVFCNAVSKAEEIKLLSSEALLRLSAAEFEEAVKMLHDYGYNEGVMNSGSFDIDLFIGGQIGMLIAFIKEYSCSDELERFLLAPYLVNNVKAEYKRRLSGVSCKLYDVPTGDVFGGDYSELHASIKDTLLRLDELNERRPQKIDEALTRALYAYRLSMAKKSRSKLLLRYARSEIDIINIISAVRGKRFGSEPMFIEGGYIGQGECSEPGGRYEHFDLNNSVKLETQGDDFLLKIALSDSSEMDSFGPTVGYVQRKMSEFKTVKMILVCIKSDARSEIPLRLRGII